MKAFFLVALPWATLGCFGIDSKLVETNRIYPWIEAIGQPDGTSQIDVTLFIGGDLSTNSVQLTDSDHLVVTMDGASVAMSNRDNLILGHYQGVAGGNAAGARVVVALYRSKKVGAPDSQGTLPARTMLSAPKSGASLSVKADIAMSWSPTLERYRVKVPGSGCVDPYSRGAQQPHSGGGMAPTGVIAKGSLKLKAGVQACPATIYLESYAKTGTIDKAFGGGTFYLGQAEKVDVTLAP